MKNFTKIVRFLLVVTFIAHFSPSFAQYENGGVGTNGGMKQSDEGLGHSVESLSQIVKQLEALNGSLRQFEVALKKSVEEKDQRIEVLEGEKVHLEEKLIFADTVIARLSNDCLRKRYDGPRVQEALVDFSKMYSPELQRSFKPLKELLTNYGSCTQELEDILKKAENDERFVHKFVEQGVKKEYKDKIKNSLYYTHWYNENWSIPFLDHVIDQAIERIEKYENDKEGERLHLLDLMEQE